MLTLAEAKADEGILAVAKVGPTSPSFAKKVNTACRRLMDYGNWWSTVTKANVAVYDRHITWPRWVNTVLFLNLRGNEMAMRGSWYEFLPLDTEDWGRIAACHADWHRMRQQCVAINDVGTSPVFNNVPSGTASYVLAYCRSSSDYKGKTLSIWGLDANGWPTQETIGFASPYVASTKAYQKITRCRKDVTADYVDVYSCATQTAGTLLDMAHYEPGETSAEYRVSHLPHPLCATQDCPASVSALVKLRHIDAVADNDLLSISNRAAIKLMMLSAEKENASDPQGAESESARAIHELNRELENNLPFIQTPIRFEAMSGVNMSRYSAV